MTKRIRSQVQAAEMRFLRKIEGLNLLHKLRNSQIRESLNVEPLLLRIERSQLRWFGHVSRMAQERFPKQALIAKPNRKRQLDDQERDGKIISSIFDGVDWGYPQMSWRRSR